MTGGIVVVLGQTGRNFAAGMSGGIAYVLDEAGDFERRCNKAMVELEAVTAEADGGAGSNGDTAANGTDVIESDPLSHDAARLKRLIERHLHYTNSARARAILARWDHYVTQFVKIVPVDYRRALKDLQIAAEIEPVAAQGKSREAANG